MHTLVLPEKPPQCAIVDGLLEYDLGPGVIGEVRWVLIGAPVGGLLRRKLIPLLTGYLAGTATSALTYIYEHCFGHILPSNAKLFTPYVTQEGLILRYSGVGIAYIGGEHIGAIPR